MSSDSVYTLSQKSTTKSEQTALGDGFMIIQSPKPLEETCKKKGKMV